MCQCDATKSHRRQSDFILTPCASLDKPTVDLNPLIYFLDQRVLVSNEPFIPHETQTDVIGQTARMLRLFHKYSCRLNLTCVADMNNETPMKKLANMNKATLTGRLRYHIYSNNYQNFAWRTLTGRLRYHIYSNNYQNFAWRSDFKMA